MATSARTDVIANASRSPAEPGDVRPETTSAMRSGTLWLSFAAAILALSVLRRPSLRVAVLALAVFLAGAAVNVLLSRVADRRGSSRWDLVRCLANGPLLVVAIGATGGFPSPAWMCAYPVVNCPSRWPARTAHLIAAYLIAVQIAAWVATGMTAEQWPEAVARAALLLASSTFFRLLVEVEDSHRRSAAESARAVERARISKLEADARFRLAEQSATHSKMASLGLLAASVAHEINSPINTIINSAQIILDGSAAAAGGERHFQQLIIGEGERVARVVTNLLQFTRGGSEEYTPTALRRVIEKTLLLLQYQLDKDRIRVEVDLPLDLPPLRARLEELQQVYINLITNARYAVLERRRDDPRLRPVIGITAVIEESSDGPHVVARVTDNGIGIPAEHLGRVFEPFFTTKSKEDGTGLGLSICSRIVREHRGELTVASVPGQGTTFTLRLPALEPGPTEQSSEIPFSAILP